MIHLPSLINYLGETAIVDNGGLEWFFVMRVWGSLRGEEGYFLLLQLPSFIYEGWQLFFWFLGFFGFFWEYFVINDGR